MQAPVRLLFQSEEEDQPPRRAALVCSCEYSTYLSLRRTSCCSTLCLGCTSQYSPRWECRKEHQHLPVPTPGKDFFKHHFHYGDILTPLVFHTLWRTITVKSSRNILGTSWMVMRERSLKYLGAQQVSQQISIFFKSKFHNEWGVCQKSYFDVFFWQWSHLSFPTISNLTDPHSHFLPISPRFLTNIRCRYFSLNIWVV